jgi:exonuclease SbcC
MRPEKLILENFGPFAGRAELDFSKLEDIFLVTGKTGSGKTTIFDAICFALYGDVPGSRHSYLNHLKSDHAEGECMVHLEFSLGKSPGKKPGSRLYVVERCPKQEIKKKRGAGATTKEETVVLWESIDGEKINLTNKKSEVNQRLLELIGLEADEFFKIVLLPQGEFAEFLRQNTSERQKVLGKLFPIEKALRVKDLAARKAAEAGAEEAAARRKLETLQTRAGTGTYEESHHKAQGTFETAKDTLNSLGEKEAVFLRLLSSRQAEAEAEEQLAESLEEGRRIGEEEHHIAEKKERLSRSRNARPLGEFLRSREEALKASRDGATALLRATTEREQAEAASREAESRGEEAARLEKELLALREQRPALLELREEEAAAAAEKKKLEACTARAKKLAQGQSGLEEELSKQEGLIAAAEALAAEGTAIDTRLEQERERMERYKKFRIFAERWEALRGEQKNLERQAKDLATQEQDLNQRIPIMTEELSHLKAEQTTAERNDMAALLGEALKEGEPCPVCGSPDHPKPAHARERQFSLQDRIGGLEKTLRDLEKLHAGVNAELQAKRAQAEQTAEETRRLDSDPTGTIPEGLAAGAALPAIAEIDAAIKALADELNKLTPRQTKAREAAREVPLLYQQRTAIQKAQGDLGRELAAAAEQEKYLAAGIADKEDRRQKLLANLPVNLPQDASGLTLAGPQAESRITIQNSAAEALAALDKAVTGYETALTQDRAKRERAGQVLAAARAAEQAAAQNQDRGAARLQEAETTLARELAASPFANAEEAENALLEAAAEEALERAIREWGDAKVRVESRTEEHRKRLGEIHAGLKTLKLPQDLPGPLPGLEETEILLGTVKTQREQAQGERDAAFAELSNLERDREELIAAQKYYGEESARAGELRALADDLTGKNPQRQPFDSWLLGCYLAEIAQYATARLEKMSEYRYSLLLESQRQNGQRGYSGLDLTVFDAHTGKTRPCATLSGGESFLASISLALGLADSIQARSGGMMLDAVFIDEGFGSLDEGTLDKAMLILDELRDHRMVGLISHVGEMSSRIPCRVEVVKTSTGSRIVTT